MWHHSPWGERREEHVSIREDSEISERKGKQQSKVFFDEGWLWRKDNTYLANDFPLPVTVLGSEYVISRETDKESLGDSWKGALASGLQFIFPLN